MKHKQERINWRLNSIVEHKYLLDLKEGGGGKLFSFSLPTTCFINDLKVYCRYIDKDYIIVLLLSLSEEKREHASMIAIIRRRKTILFQVVYNNFKVKSYFEVRSWFCIYKVPVYFK